MSTLKLSEGGFCPGDFFWGDFVRGGLCPGELCPYPPLPMPVWETRWSPAPTDPVPLPHSPHAFLVWESCGSPAIGYDPAVVPHNIIITLNENNYLLPLFHY